MLYNYFIFLPFNIYFHQESFMSQLKIKISFDQFLTTITIKTS